MGYEILLVAFYINLGKVILMPENKNLNLLQRLGKYSDSLTPKQICLAEYIEKNYPSLAYITMTKLAHLADVSETTVVRLIYALGYSGFPEFKNALRMTIEQTATVASGMSRYELGSQKYKFPQDACKAIFDLEMQITQETFANIDMEEHQKAVDLIYSAPMVIVLGCGANSCCSQALGFALQVILKNVHIVEDLGLEEGALLRDVPEGTVCIAFSTPRYPRTTQEILEILKNNKAKIIGCSDSMLSPVVPFCDVFFQVPEKYVTFIDTNAAFMALIHSIVFALHFKDKAKFKKRIESYNEFTRKQKFYVKDFLELVEF